MLCQIFVPTFFHLFVPCDVKGELTLLASSTFWMIRYQPGVRETKNQGNILFPGGFWFGARVHPGLTNQLSHISVFPFGAKQISKIFTQKVVVQRIIRSRSVGQRFGETLDHRPCSFGLVGSFFPLFAAKDVLRTQCNDPASKKSPVPEPLRPHKTSWPPTVAQPEETSSLSHDGAVQLGVGAGLLSRLSLIQEPLHGAPEILLDGYKFSTLFSFRASPVLKNWRQT